ncbi:MAG: type II methionyl aminopeptidase [Thermoplasmata archaeon]|nr:type II methionyl aminopeptidase [Thermoplasmata archaeon]
MAPYPADLDRWRRAGRIAGEARELGLRLARPGMARRELADRVEGFIRDQGAEPAFPANLSRNWEAAHYTPSETDTELLAAGDLLKVDVGAHLDGAIADTAATIEVGETHRHDRLVRAARDAVDAGIRAIRPGGPIDAVSRAIERAIHAQGYKPVVDLTGHTIQPYLLHAGKSVPNAGGYSTASLDEGEVVAIEPFVTNGEGHIEDGPFGNIVRFRADPGNEDPALAQAFARFRTLPFTARWVAAPDEKTALRRARRLLQTYPVFVETGRGWVAQAEHTVLVGPAGAEVLTAV